MKINFNAALKELLVHEGGFVNNPRDPGGMTNLGVTKATYEDWIGHPVNEQVMRSLTPQLVASLYKKRYWDVVRGDELPAGLDMCVFDFAVNAGTKRAVRYLQRIVGAPLEQQDGVLGPKTISLLEQLSRSIGAAGLVLRYQDARRSYYRKLPTFGTFGRGWLRRVDEVERTALVTAKRTVG